MENKKFNPPYQPGSSPLDKAFLLYGDRNFIEGAPGVGGRGSHSAVAVVILPEPIRADVVVAAWSYAVRKSADGLDVPNYQSAIKLLMQRHPTWKASITKGYTISFSSEKADDDVPD